MLILSKYPNNMHRKYYFVYYEFILFYTIVYLHFFESIDTGSFYGLLINTIKPI